MATNVTELGDKVSQVKDQTDQTILTMQSEFLKLLEKRDIQYITENREKEGQHAKVIELLTARLINVEINSTKQSNLISSL